MSVEGIVWTIFKIIYTHCEKRESITLFLFLEASDEILVRRFSETRRKHPLSDGKGNLSAIIAEKAYLKEIRDQANYIIDTTDYTIKDLKDKLMTIVSSVSNEQSFNTLNVNIISFGYKRGIPIEC